MHNQVVLSLLNFNTDSKESIYNYKKLPDLISHDTITKSKLNKMVKFIAHNLSRTNSSQGHIDEAWNLLNNSLQSASNLLFLNLDFSSDVKKVSKSYTMLIKFLHICKIMRDMKRLKDTTSSLLVSSFEFKIMRENKDEEAEVSLCKFVFNCLIFKLSPFKQNLKEMNFFKNACLEYNTLLNQDFFEESTQKTILEKTKQEQTALKLLYPGKLVDTDDPIYIKYGLMQNLEEENYKKFISLMDHESEQFTMLTLMLSLEEDRIKQESFYTTSSPLYSFVNHSKDDFIDRNAAQKFKKFL